MSDLSFQNNVPDLLLCGKELPFFKFELEKSRETVLERKRLSTNFPSPKESPVYPCNSSRA
jgi:hypothetical protein